MRLKYALHLIDIAADDVERFFGHRQRQQVGQIGAAADAPGDVLGNQSGLDALGDLPDAIEMRRVEAFGAAERKTDAVQRDRKVAANGVEITHRRSAAHVVLGVDFHEGHGGRVSSTA